MGPLDQGYWPDGVYTAPTDAALRFDLETIKRLGFNLVRKHAKVEPQRWYYWADKLGLLVWQDMPSIWYPDDTPAESRVQFEHEWQTIIDQHANSPAIVAWVPFNETGALTTCRASPPGQNSWTPPGWSTGTPVTTTRPDTVPPPVIPATVTSTTCTSTSAPANRRFRRRRGRHPSENNGGIGMVVPDHVWPVKTGAYQMFKSTGALTSRYGGLQTRLAVLVKEKGLGAAVYTQITDVEHEINGFVTFDRKVEKMDFARVRAANLAVLKTAADANPL